MAAAGVRTFTILHTNDMHSAFIGMGPASDYTPLTVDDDTTRGGYARPATVIATRKKARESQGPVLVLDAGDFSMGTPFAAASREVGGELRLMSRMGYDATTFGNHEFDLGPDGLGKAIGVASKAGRIPAVISSNSDFAGNDPTLADLQLLSRAGVVRRYLVIERRGIHFGLLGLLGKEAQIYTSGGAVKFPDPVASAKEVVKLLRETEKVDVVIALSHGGVERGKDGRYSAGEDVGLAEAVPGIDVVIGGHSHTELQDAIIVNGRTPVVQTGKEGQNLGELVVTVDGAALTVDSYRLHPIDDSIAGERAIVDQIDKLKKGVSAAAFASRGYSIDQPLAMTPRDLPNTFTDIPAGTILASSSSWVARRTPASISRAPPACGFATTRRARHSMSGPASSSATSTAATVRSTSAARMTTDQGSRAVGDGPERRGTRRPDWRLSRARFGTSHQGPMPGAGFKRGPEHHQRDHEGARAVAGAPQDHDHPDSVADCTRVVVQHHLCRPQPVRPPQRRRHGDHVRLRARYRPPSC